MENKNSGYGKIILLVLFLALILGNYFQYQLSPLAPQLMEEMSMTPAQFSSAFSSPMIPAILLGIVAGVLSDKFGVKKVTSVGLIITMIGLCYRPFASNYTTLMIGMVMGGIGVTFINVNMSKIVGGWYPPEKVGPMVGIAMVGSTLGMTLGTATTAMLPSIKFAFWVSGIASVVIAVIWILFMKDGKKQAAGPEQTESVLDSIKVVIKSKNIWLVGLCLMCALGCNVSLVSFLPTALQSRGISASSAGFIASALTIGSLIGTFAGPTIVAKSKRMKPWLLIFGAFLGIGAVFAWRFSTVPAIALLLIAGFGMGTLIPVFMSFPMLLPEIGPAYAGSAGGVITTLELLGAVIIPTYIITPIAGQNFSLYFILAGVVMLLMMFIVLLLPELNKK